MGTIPNKLLERLRDGIKRYQPIILAAKNRDVSEADTVTIVRDILADVFGYDKFSEITAEYAIRGTYCDLSTQFDDKLQCLIEVKAVGQDLKDSHVKQAVDYAANKGTEWVMLTNGACWRIYRVTFTQPIDHELVVEVDFCSLSAKDDEHLEILYLFTREGWAKSALGEYHTQKEALSRFVVGATILSDPVVDIVRRELRRAFPEVRIDKDKVRQVLFEEVLKREVVEGEKADEARKRIAKAQKPSKDKAAPEANETQSVVNPVSPPIPVQAPASPPPSQA